MNKAEEQYPVQTGSTFAKGIFIGGCWEQLQHYSLLLNQDVNCVVTFPRKWAWLLTAPKKWQRL